MKKRSRLDSLFKLDLFIYKSLLVPKTLLESIKYRKARKVAKRNAELPKNEKKSDVVYICGNGPSLNKVDLNDIDCDYIVVNDFYRFQKKNPNNPPKYYLILDDAYLWPGFEDRYEKLFDPGFETTYVITAAMKHAVERDHPDKKVYYFCPFGNLFSRKHKCDYTKVVGRSWNVVSEAIIFAMYLGYKEIRLLGCDYSVFATTAHFYGNAGMSTTLRRMLFRYAFSTHIHYEIAECAKKRGIKIVNMTKDTLLDAYEIDTNSKY